VIRLHPQTGQRHLDWLTWGLLPHWTRNLKSAPRPIHARAETVAELPTFVDAFRHRRAVVPVAEYFQRRTVGSPAGQRYTVARADGQPMAIAGLWEAFRATNGDVVRTYCIITVRSSGPVAAIHDRMPLVLEERDWAVWLGEVSGDPKQLLRPSANELLVVRPLDGQKPGSSTAGGKSSCNVQPLLDDHEPGGDPALVQGHR
jgi:putative SOS response-associated peptidase YedK